MQRDEIALRQQSLQRHQLDLHFTRSSLTNVRVVAKHPHIESFRAHRNFTADTPKPDEPQRLAAHFRPSRAGFLPTAFVNGLVMSRHLPGQR